MPFHQPLPPIASLLVVDDSSVQREHAIALCRSLGTELVYEANDGQQALDLLGMLALAPDLMLIDLEMPGMDGIELIHQLHQRQLRIPFLIASSREQALLDSVEVMARALGLPVLGGVHKPLGEAVLRDTLQRGAAQLPSHGCAPMPSVDVDARMLEAALGGDPAHGTIGVHYQPKIDIRTGIARGVEALARWQHPTLGWIPPDNFVAVAERERSIHRLTMSVAEQALAQAAAWNMRGLKLSVAINLSPKLLDSATLVGELSALVTRHGLSTDQVMLEITESSVVDYLGASLGVLARLRLKGFGLSIDDYGTGFSSMQQLARVPFTELKIDRSFVHGASLHTNLRVILQSALDMSRRLGLVTVAEGVETLDDWRLLQSFGCNVGQGYLIAKPMPGTAVPAWIKTHAVRLPDLRADPAHDLPPSPEPGAPAAEGGPPSRFH